MGVSVGVGGEGSFMVLVVPSIALDTFVELLTSEGDSGVVALVSVLDGSRLHIYMSDGN